MCGDGANDLLALREADLSIGVQSTDASYGSSFTVKNMIDVDWVIK
jgi:P-type E1-E2 ATPase